MKTTADRSEQFWHLAANKLCELRGIDPLLRVRIKQDDGRAVAVSTTAHAVTVRELKNVHQQIDALEHAENIEDMLAMVGKTVYLLNEQKGLTEDLTVGTKVTITSVNVSNGLFVITSDSGEVFEVKDSDLGEYDPGEYDN